MKKDYENYIIHGLLVLVVVGFVFVVINFPVDKPRLSMTNNIAYEPSFKSIATGSTSSGDVSIELTPQNVNNGQLVVDIAVNTHSVDLSQFDLKEITTLEYNGKTVNPISAPILGGHHSNGELIFEVDGEIDSFTIRIKSIPKVDERIFTWS